MTDFRREHREITDRSAWLTLRREHITGSRVAALFDVHPYMTREQLAGQLRGVDQGDNAAMRAGRILEPGVLVALAEDHPEWQITKASTYHWLPEHRLGSTPDAWLGDDALIQVKTVSPENWQEWRGKVPLAYTLQTLTEMIVTGRSRGMIAVMVRSRSFPVYEFPVPRHEAAEARIIAAVTEWWRAWDAGEIAAPADIAGLDEALDDGSSIDLSADNELGVILAERATLKQTVGASTTRLKEIDYEIKNKLGHARFGWLPGWRLAYPTIDAKAYTVEARQYRRLTVTAKEEEEGL